jgi:hypothetical protein
MYELYVDTPKSMSCTLQVKGTNLEQTSVRLILETETANLFYNGEVYSDGKCKINIPKLKNLLQEGTLGTAKLEVIADSTVFVPWESNFQVTAKKNVSVLFEDESFEDESKGVKIKMDEEIESEIEVEKKSKKIPTEKKVQESKNSDSFDLKTFKNF